MVFKGKIEASVSFDLKPDCTSLPGKTIEEIYCTENKIMFYTITNHYMITVYIQRYSVLPDFSAKHF